MDKPLSPLPPSDPDSLAKNIYDPQFRRGARDFWGDNKIEHITVKETKCKHYFSITKRGVGCNKCHVEWLGREFTARDGKLYKGKIDVSF